MPPVAPRRRDWEKSCGSARYPGHHQVELKLCTSFWVLGIGYGTAMVKYLKFMLMGLYHVIPQCKDQPKQPARSSFCRHHDAGENHDLLNH